MQPQSPQNQASGPASLPPLVPAASQADQQAPSSTVPPKGSGLSATEAVRIRAKQVVAQYGNNPFQLSEVLSQIKNEYLTQELHIHINSVEQ